MRILSFELFDYLGQGQFDSAFFLFPNKISTDNPQASGVTEII